VVRFKAVADHLSGLTFRGQVNDGWSKMKREEQDENRLPIPETPALSAGS
jgi:hypothetical protein